MATSPPLSPAALAKTEIRVQRIWHLGFPRPTTKGSWDGLGDLWRRLANTWAGMDQRAEFGLRHRLVEPGAFTSCIISRSIMIFRYHNTYSAFVSYQHLVPPCGNDFLCSDHRWCSERVTSHLAHHHPNKVNSYIIASMPSAENRPVNMLPPLDPAVLERNPKFKALYDDLLQNKLNADASTKNTKKQIQAERAREVSISWRLLLPL